MTGIRLVNSSVPRESAQHRAALRDYLRGDALMRRFFEAFPVRGCAGRRAACLSVSSSPLPAEPMYRANDIERMGTGMRGVILRCREAGLAEPEFSGSDDFPTTIRRKSREDAGKVAPEVTSDVTGKVVRLPQAFTAEHGPQQIQERFGLKREESSRALYLVPALEHGRIEVTRPMRLGVGCRHIPRWPRAAPSPI